MLTHASQASATEARNENAELRASGIAPGGE